MHINKSNSKVFPISDSCSGSEDKTFDISKYSARNYQDVPTMIEDSQQTLDSTCDISRLVRALFVITL